FSRDWSSDVCSSDLIIKTMHRAFADRGEDRGVADFVIDAGKNGGRIVGRLVDKGLHNELTGEAYAVIDGLDGCAHHVRLRGVEADRKSVGWGEGGGR